MTPDTKQGEGLWEATPRPWWREGSGFGGFFLNPPVTPNGKGRTIGSISKPEDSALIIEAVNNYDALKQRVKVLEEALEIKAADAETWRKRFLSERDSAENLARALIGPVAALQEIAESSVTGDTDQEERYKLTRFQCGQIARKALARPRRRIRIYRRQR